jgi:hypothetical protein
MPENVGGEELVSDTGPFLYGILSSEDRSKSTRLGLSATRY